MSDTIPNVGDEDFAGRTADVKLDTTSDIEGNNQSLERETYVHALPSAGQGSETPDDMIEKAPGSDKDFFRS